MIKPLAIMWSRLRPRTQAHATAPPVVTRIEVRQLGLATGKVVVVRRPRRIKINVRYIP